MARSLILMVVGLLALALGCHSYNVLVDKDQAAQQKWADVEVQLQRRADLVPNLVATVKGSAAHEQQTLDAVTKARAEATSIHLSQEDLSDPDKLAAFEKAQGALQGSLSRLLVVQEQYPDLKANAQFHDLMIELEGTENRIARAREEYNRAAADYNAELAHVRGQVVNRATGRPFRPRAYFTGTPEAQTAPTVAF